MPKSDSSHTAQHSTQMSSFKKFQQGLEDMVNISWSGNRTFDNMFGFILNTYLMASYLLEYALNSRKSTSTADHKQDSREPQSSTKHTTESHDVTITPDKKQSAPSNTQQQMREAYQQAQEKSPGEPHNSTQSAGVEILEARPKPQ
jgi:hypothetical protein